MDSPYLNVFNDYEVRIHELYRELSQATQGIMSVTSYFGYPKKQEGRVWCLYLTSWYYGDDSCGCFRDSEARRRVEDLSVSLALNSDYDAIGTQVSNTSPLPSFSETCALIEKHERRMK